MKWHCITPGLDPGWTLARNIADQAEGLRRLFAADAAHMVAVLGKDGQDISAGLAVALTGKGRKVLLLDEQLRAGDTHPLFLTPVRHDIGAALRGEKSLQEVVVPVAGMTLLPAGAVRAVGVNESARVRLLAAFHALAQMYDVVLIHASPTMPASQRRGLGFALAAPEVVVLCDCTSAGITAAYSQIKAMAQVPGERHFRLMFRGEDQRLADVLFRNLAGVCRQHLRHMPSSAGVLPTESMAAAIALESLADDMARWPLPERDDSRFEAFMRRLLSATGSHLQAAAEH